MLVFDLDGTLLDYDKNLVKKDIEAIGSAVQQGIGLTIATGRMDHEILHILDVLGQPGVGHRVSQNGSFVYNRQGEQIASHTFDEDTAKHLYTLVPEDEVFLSVSTETDTYVRAKNEGTKEMEKRMFHEILEDEQLYTKLGQDISPSKISVHGPTERLIEKQKEIDEALGHALDSFISDPYCLDMVPKGVSKGASLSELLTHLNLKPEEVACVGDSFNDISMFELTPYSFAMSHGHSDVKKKASQVVDYAYEAVNFVFSTQSTN